jgi:hypothetical protein
MAPIASQKLAGAAVLEARFHENVTYKPVPLASVTTVEKGAAGLAGDSGKADDSSKKDEKKSDDKPADDGSKKRRGSASRS